MNRVSPPPAVLLKRDEKELSRMLLQKGQGETRSEILDVQYFKYVDPKKDII